MRFLGIAAAVLLVSPALAQPAMTADEIVEKFIASADLGADRAICIGTAEECSAQPKAPASLDMRVTFELDSAVLTSDAEATLREFARALNDPRLSIASFKVEGHTDARGSDAYNAELSERRADTVTARLIDLGVEPDRIEARGFGESRPVATDPFDPDNRRVEARMVLPSN